MNRLQIFSNPEFGDIRTINESGRVLFCGADVAQALGYSNVRDAINRHCKGVVKRDTPAKSGKQSIPLALLVVCNIIDYFTGLAAAPGRDQQRNSNKGFAGIAKKICMWLLVGVGVIIDALLVYVAGTFGWTPPITFTVACIVCVWLLVNEIISIIESIDDIGASVPLLLPLVKWVKKKAEDTTKLPDETEG